MNRTVALGCLGLFLWAVECRADAPAGRSPPRVAIDADLTQVVGDGTNRYLFVYVTIENQSLATLKLSSASFRLQVGDLVQRHAVPESGQRSISVVVAAGVSDEEPAADLPDRGDRMRLVRDAEKEAAELPWFEGGPLSAGKKRSGWLCFNLTEIGHVDDDFGLFSGPSWRLVVALRDGATTFDLKEHEIRALAARRRPSQLDPRVSVIEIGSRLNSLNVAALAEIAEGILTREPGFVAVFSQGACLIEESAAARLGRVDSRPESPKFLVNGDDASPRSHRLGWRQRADSEAAATVGILAQRLDTVPNVVRYLSEGPLDVRLAAAEALAPYVASADVREALAQAAKPVAGKFPRGQPPPNIDENVPPPALRRRFVRRGMFQPPAFQPPTQSPETKLRFVALYALGSPTICHVRGRGPGSADTLAIIAALDDPDTEVRRTAASVADRFPYPPVIDRLMRLLDDSAVQINACQKLAALNYQPAKEKLETLRQSSTGPWAAYSVIQALESLGAMSHAEALLAKIDSRDLGRDDCIDLIKLKDPRSIPKLLALLKNESDLLRTQAAVETLIALQMPETVEALIDVLNLMLVDRRGKIVGGQPGPPHIRFAVGDNSVREAIIRALAALGDPRAIAPIRAALNAQQYASLQQRLLYFDALLELHDPEALKFTEKLPGMDDPAQVEALLTMMVRHDDERVLPLMEEYLHKEQFAAVAAEKLSYLLSDAAQKALAGRLKQTGHALHGRWVEGVIRNPIWLVDHRDLVPDAVAAPVPSDAFRGYEGVQQRQISRQRWPRREMLGDRDSLAEWFKQAPRHLAETVECRVDATQEVGDCLLLRLSLVNHGDTALKIAASDFALQIDGEWSPAIRLLADAPPPTVVAPALVHRLSASAIRYWGDAELPPGETVHGWLGFEFASAARTLPSAQGAACTLYIKAGERAAAFDLTNNELDALHITDRRSSFHDSLHVIEIEGRLNSLNIKLFIERLHHLTADDRGYMIVADAKTCLVTNPALSTWRDWLKKHATDDTMPVLVVGRLQDGQVWNALSPEVHRYRTEELGAIALLARRPGSGRLLLAHLADERFAVRAAVAEALSHHLAEEGVAEALISLLNDLHPAVRMAAAQAITEPKQPLPDALRQPGSPMETAVLAAMDSPDRVVSTSARYAAQWFPTDRVERALLEVIEAWPEDTGALSSLIKLNPQAAVEGLKRCLNRGEHARAFALNQLDKLGEIPHVEAVLGKLDLRHAGMDAFKEAGKIHDPRIIAKLISLIEEPDVGIPPRPRIDSFATQALVELRAKEAVEPLCALLSNPARENEALSIIHTLARLDDRRAIAPIRQALRQAPPEWRLRLNYYVALARLDDRAALDTLSRLLKERLPFNETRLLLSNLGFSGHEELVALVEPFLDDKDFCSDAAYALSHAGTANSLASLRRRLTAADYRFAAELFEGLRRGSDWLSSPAGQLLLRDAAEGDNASARQIAQALLVARNVDE